MTTLQEVTNRFPKLPTELMRNRLARPEPGRSGHHRYGYGK